jgi:hypothetical protein
MSTPNPDTNAEKIQIVTTTSGMRIAQWTRSVEVQAAAQSMQTQLLNTNPKRQAI